MWLILQQDKPDNYDEQERFAEKAPMRLNYKIILKLIKIY